MGFLIGTLRFSPHLEVRQSSKLLQFLENVYHSLQWDNSSNSWILTSLTSIEHYVLDIDEVYARLQCFNAMYLTIWQVSMEASLQFQDAQYSYHIIAEPIFNNTGCEQGSTLTMIKQCKIHRREEAPAPSFKFKNFEPCPPQEIRFLAADNSTFGRLPLDTIAKMTRYMDPLDVVQFRKISKSAHMACSSEYLRNPWLKEGLRGRLLVSVFPDPFNSLIFATIGYDVKNNMQVESALNLIPQNGYIPVSASGKLVCCLKNDTDVMVVGNPVAKEWIVLPPCPVVHFTKWHIVSWPDGGGKGDMFFVVFETTLQCWFDSKLGTWNLGDGFSPYEIVSTNLVMTSDGVYGMVKLLEVSPPQAQAQWLVGDIGLLKLNVENFRASNLLHTWQSIDGDKNMTIFEHKKQIAVKTDYWYWTLDQRTWEWELTAPNEVVPWNQVLRNWQIDNKLWVLDLETSLFGSPNISKGDKKESCASKYWTAYSMS